MHYLTLKEKMEKKIFCSRILYLKVQYMFSDQLNVREGLHILHVRRGCKCLYKEFSSYLFLSLFSFCSFCGFWTAISFIFHWCLPFLLPLRLFSIFSYSFSFLRRLFILKFLVLRWPKIFRETSLFWSAVMACPSCIAFFWTPATMLCRWGVSSSPIFRVSTSAWIYTWFEFRTTSSATFVTSTAVAWLNWCIISGLTTATEWWA